MAQKHSLRIFHRQIGVAIQSSSMSRHGWGSVKLLSLTQQCEHTHTRRPPHDWPMLFDLCWLTDYERLHTTKCIHTNKVCGHPSYKPWGVHMCLQLVTAICSFHSSGQTFQQYVGTQLQESAQIQPQTRWHQQVWKSVKSPCGCPMIADYHFKPSS